MTHDRDRLCALIAEEIARPVPPEVATLADAARARHERSGGVLAVLAYGSTLRDATPEESLVDLYVLTTDLAAVSPRLAARLGCRLVPPNVHYTEAGYGGRTWRAKHAVLPLDLFARKMRPDVSNPYFWARFSQPCRLVWSRDDAARKAVTDALAQAVETMLEAGLSVARPGDGWQEIWTRALEATYATELRPESASRAALIVERNAGWCRETARAVLGEDFAVTAETPRPAIRWRLRVLAGKALSILRLAKAAFTFTGGAEYIAWKIERHSGVHVELKPWQKRHPLLAALWLLPGLLRRGAIR